MKTDEKGDKRALPCDSEAVSVHADVPLVRAPGVERSVPRLENKRVLIPANGKLDGNTRSAVNARNESHVYILGLRRTVFRIPERSLNGFGSTI